MVGGQAEDWSVSPLFCMEFLGSPLFSAQEGSAGVVCLSGQVDSVFLPQKRWNAALPQRLESH